MRVHQHVNPLSSKYLVVPEIPDWSVTFQSVNKPLHLDIGCAAGHFLIKMAQLHLDWNFLGIEIRKPLVDRANRWKAELGLNNLYFFFGQLQVVLDPILCSLPQGVLQFVSINFPDPWFKKRHHKRRMINSEVVDILSKYMKPKGKVFIQTDVNELMNEMMKLFEANLYFKLIADKMEQSPFEIPTEREVSAVRLGRRIYRVMYECNLERAKINSRN